MWFKAFAKKPAFSIIACFLLILIIKIFASAPFWVENHFSTRFFPGFSGLLRVATGWLPFSTGDILYILAGMFLVYKTARFLIIVIKKRNTFRLRLLGKSILKILLTAMAIYIVFNIFWGLNYDRRGITHQLDLEIKSYTASDLEDIQQLLTEKVNTTKRVLINAHTGYPSRKELFSRANNCYRQSVRLYPFMQYDHASIKPSLFGRWGNYLGYTGYYNPFTGEAQVNTTVPAFVLPYTTCHEIAHQIGYAKENEANFAGYLAATSSADTLFHYSAYLELFLYTNHEVYFADSSSAKKAFNSLSPEVRSDIHEWRAFILRHETFVDDIVTWMYTKYLKANQQPAGMQTYNEVVADLIAFYKKTGRI